MPQRPKVSQRLTLKCWYFFCVSLSLGSKINVNTPNYISNQFLEVGLMRVRYDHGKFAVTVILLTLSIFNLSRENFSISL